MNFKEFYFESISSNIIYRHIDSESYGWDDEEEIPEHWIEQAHGLQNSAGINILRGKELTYVAVDVNEDQAIGALFTEFDGEQYSFDVLVHSQYRNQGVGRELTKIGIEEFQAYADIEGAYMELDVVNPIMEKLLKSLGFRVKRRIGQHAMMVVRNNSK